MKEKEILKKKLAEKKKIQDDIDAFDNRSEEELSDSDDGFL